MTFIATAKTVSPAAERTRPIRLSKPLTVLGEILISAGVVVALFGVYDLFFTNFSEARSQHRLYQAIQREWRMPARKVPPLRLGDGMALLFIPRLGSHYRQVIVQGVDWLDLTEGPGHIPGTAMPGRVGNFVVSGHRTTYGHPFWDLNELRTGDPIGIETRSDWFVYDVISKEVVLPTDLAVIAPVPDHPGERPWQAMLTFTTCNPRFSASERLVVHGRLVLRQPRPTGRPAMLDG
jgi:sortase A